jgi:hypothetical protein
MFCSHEALPVLVLLRHEEKQLQSPEQGGKLLGLLLTGSTGQHMAGRNGLA